MQFLRYGWPINHDGSNISLSKPKNQKGATDFPDFVESYIHKELVEGAIVGPITRNSLGTPLVLSPLNTTPKKDTSERRTLHNLSFPPNRSVNDGIDKYSYLGEPIKISLPSVSDFADLLKHIDPTLTNVLMYKFDVRRCYRQIRIDPGDIHLLGFHWGSNFYADISLPMGLRSSVYICQRLTSAIQYIADKRGLSIQNYIDDFPGCQVAPRAEVDAFTFSDILRSSGLEENLDKRCLPNKRMTFKGVMFDLGTRTLEITPDRLTEIIVELEGWLSKEKASRREVQVIVGRLNFVSDCVRPGKIFMGRLLAFLRSTPKRGKINIPPDCIKDVAWWRYFMESYNGVSMLSVESWSSPDSIMATDACLTGGGGWSEGEYFHCSFPDFITSQPLDINSLELLVIVVALKLWKRKLKGKKILIHCDNMTSVEVLNAGKARDPFLLCCLREIVFIAAGSEFEVKAVHIPGANNRIPDLLSRWETNPKAEREFMARTEGIRVREMFVYSGLFKFLHEW